MSPVFPLLLKKIVSIGLKNELRVGTFIPQLSSPISLFYLGNNIGKGRFQFEVLSLIQLITKNRLRHASGPAHFKH